MIQSLRDRLRNSSYFRDIIWQASGNSLAQLIGVLGIPVLTRLYAPQDFAVQNLFLQVISLLAGIMTWRYEYFIQLPKDETDSDSLLKLVLLLGLGMLLVLTPTFWMFQDEVARWAGDPALATWLVYAPLSALLVSSAIGFQHKVQRYKDYRRSGLSELAGKSAYIGSGVLGSVVSTSAMGLIIAPALSALGKISFLLHSAKDNQFCSLFLSNNGQKKERRFYDIRRLARSYFRLANSMVYSHLMMTCTAALPAIYIAHAYGAEALGQFTLVSSTLYLPAGLIGAAIGQVYYQRAAERWADNKSFSDLWQVTAKRLIHIGLPVYGSAALISPWVYPLVFGSAWQQAGSVASLMAIAAFFSFISSPLDRTSLVIGAWWYLPIWHTLRTATTIAIVTVAWLNKYGFEVFLQLLVAQMSFMYLIDFYFERYFSSHQP